MGSKSDMERISHRAILRERKVLATLSTKCFNKGSDNFKENRKLFGVNLNV